MENIKTEISQAQADKANRHSTKLSDYIKNPGRKAMIIGVVLAALNHLTGSFALIAYAGTVFQKSGSALSPNDSALIIGFIQLIGTFLVPLCVEWTGRKVRTIKHLKISDVEIISPLDVVRYIDNLICGGFRRARHLSIVSIVGL